MKVWIVGYQEVYDCSVRVTANNEMDAIKKAKSHCEEAKGTYELGEPYKELWSKAGADLIGEQ